MIHEFIWRRATALFLEALTTPSRLQMRPSRGGWHPAARYWLADGSERFLLTANHAEGGEGMTSMAEASPNRGRTL